MQDPLPSLNEKYSNTCDFPSPRNIKAFKYVKIPKQPFGVHSPTSDTIKKSSKFGDIIVSRRPSDPIDLAWGMAKYHRTHRPGPDK